MFNSGRIKKKSLKFCYDNLPLWVTMEKIFWLYHNFGYLPQPAHMYRQNPSVEKKNK